MCDNVILPERQKMPQPLSSAPQDISSPKGKKLLDQYRDALRIKHYSPRTEDTYINWVKNYILYHNKRHPKEMGVPEIGQFLTHLATAQEVSASTHTALVFGARGIRLLAPSSSSIVMSSTLNSMNSNSRNFAPSAPKPYQLSSQKMKSNGSSPASQAQINSSPRSCMAADCASWNVCACGSKT